MATRCDRAWGRTKEKVTGNGAADRDVRAAQRALQAKGFDPGPIDGVMGPRTSAALRDFQEKENLEATGPLDAETRSRLMASSRRARRLTPGGADRAEREPQTR